MEERPDIDYIIHSLVAVSREIRAGGNDFYTSKFPEKENPGIWNFAGSYLNRNDRLVLFHREKQQPVACLLGRITSSIMADIYREPVGSIDLCWVEPQYRRSGVARLLVKQAEDWFNQREIQVVELSYMANNLLATQVWEKLNYQPFRIFACKKLEPGE